MVANLDYTKLKSRVLNATNGNIPIESIFNTWSKRPSWEFVDKEFTVSLRLDSNKLAYFD